MIYHCFPQHTIQHITANTNYSPQDYKHGLQPLFGLMEYEDTTFMNYENSSIEMEYE